MARRRLIALSISTLAACATAPPVARAPEQPPEPRRTLRWIDLARCHAPASEEVPDTVDVRLDPDGTLHVVRVDPRLPAAERACFVGRIESARLEAPPSASEVAEGLRLDEIGHAPGDDPAPLSRREIVPMVEALAPAVARCRGPGDDAVAMVEMTVATDGAIRADEVEPLAGALSDGAARCIAAAVGKARLHPLWWPEQVRFPFRPGR